MRRLALVLIPFAALAMPANAAVRTFSPGNFDRVESAGPVDVRIVAGRPGVSAEGPQQAIDRLAVETRGGVLWIGVRQGEGGWRTWFNGSGRVGRVVVTVSTPGIRGVRLSGPGNVAVDRMRAAVLDLTLIGPGNLSVGAVETPSLTLRLSGPGDVRLAGRADTADVHLSGPGDIHAEALSVGDARLRLSGPGDITIAAQRSATGALSGPGDITIVGPARCDIRKSGPGEVRCRR